MDFRDGGACGLVVWMGWGVAGWFWIWGGGLLHCLNQDLQDFDGFSGWGGPAGWWFGWGGGWLAFLVV